MNQTIAIFDLDGTLIKGQSQKRLLSFLLRNGVVNFKDVLLINGWFILYKLLPIISPEKMMIKSATLFSGHKETHIKKVFDEFVKSNLYGHFNSSIVDLLNSHKKRGDIVILLTNAFRPLAVSVAERLGIHEIIASELECEDGVYSGRIKNIVYGDSKVSALESYLKKYVNVKLDIDYVYADHISDIALLNLANFSFVVNPGRNMKKEAKKRGWIILNVS